MATPGNKLETNKLKTKTKTKTLRTFHASLQVVRLEDWSVEAETEEEARALLASGAGERNRVGDCVYFEIQDLSEG